MPTAEAAAQAGKTSDQAGRGREAAKHDRSLIRWSLALRPEERLAVLQDFVDTFWTPKHG